MEFLRVQGTFSYMISRVYVTRVIHKISYCDVCCAPPKV